MDYLPGGAPPPAADEIPAGQRLVHNHVRPARRQGTRGFRFWLQQSAGGPPITPCNCGWSPESGRHYRVVRTITTASVFS